MSCDIGSATESVRPSPMSFLLKRAILLSAAVFVYTRSARATTFVLTDTEHLLAISDTVVIGHVSTIRSVVQQNDVRTNVVVVVEEMLKGPPTAEITLVEPGGVVGDQRRWVYGAPTFFVGERVLVFATANSRQELETTFLAMGKFSVLRGTDGTELAVRSLLDARVLSPRNGKMETQPPVTSQALAGLVDGLRALGTLNWRRPLPLANRVAHGTRWQEHFTFAGPPRSRWFQPDEGQPVAYRIGADGDATLGAPASEQAANAALAVWSNTGCGSLRLIDAGSAEPTPFSSCDGRTQISFNDPFSEIPDPVDCTGVLAVGGDCTDNVPLTFNGTPFYPITEGDIVVNNGFGNCAFWNGSNLAELLTHEVGHTIGLAHSSDDAEERDTSLRDATMYYAAHFDGRGAQLMSDDLAGVCALYPSGRTASVTFRRFAIVFDASQQTPSDRLVVDGELRLEDGQFNWRTDTLIMDLQTAGASTFRLAVVPGMWTINLAGSRFLYRGAAGSGTATLMVSTVEPGMLHLSMRARGLDLSSAQADPVTMTLAVGTASASQTVSGLRVRSRSRVFP